MPPKRKPSTKSRRARPAAARPTRTVRPTKAAARKRTTARARPGRAKATVPKRRSKVTAAARPIALELPLIHQEDTAADAIALMREHGRSGVIGWAGERSWLYEASAIVIAVAGNPQVRLRDVQPTVELTNRVEQVDLVGIVAPFTFNRLPEPSFDDLRGLSGPQPLRLGVDAALIRSLAVGPSDCYCQVDRKPVSGGETGGNCPYGHLGTVRCV